MKYQNCIFDLYGTLIDIRTDEGEPELWEKMADYYLKNGASYRPGELQEAYKRCVSERENSSLQLRQDAHEAHPEIQIEYVFQQMYEEKGVFCDMRRAVEAGRYFRECSLKYIRLYPYAKELLHTLRENGCGVWLLSNAQAIFTRYELDILDLTDCFDAIYLSSDYGCKKPDQKFFHLFLEQTGVDPQTAVMIGNDGICDIQGARQAGLATVYLHSNISPQEDLPEADLALPEMDLKRVAEFVTVQS